MEVAFGMGCMGIIPETRRQAKGGAQHGKAFKMHLLGKGRALHV